jgi:hypothetical protein
MLGIGNVWAQVSAYTFAQSTGTYTAITGGTVYGTTTSDDQRFVTTATPAGGTNTTGIGLPIGFNFTFNGQVYDRLAINNNGWISLGSSTLTPSVHIVSTSSYLPLESTTTTTPAHLRNRIAGVALDLEGQTGSSIRLETIGTSPNRVCVVQWTNYREYGSTGHSFNFQIRLNETSNVVEIVFGTMTFNATAFTAHVGLGGSVNTDFNNRQTTTNWNSTTAGTANTNSCTLSTSVTAPTSGRTFTWTPPVPCSGTPAGGTATSSVSGICTGSSTTTILGLTGGATGTGLTYQWQSSPAGAGTWSAISGATTVPFTTASISTATDFRLVTTCTNGGATANSTTVTLGVVNCQYNVTRSTGITYSSIMSTGSTYSSLSSADDGFTNIVSLAGTTFQYRGQPVTGFYATTNGTMSFSSTQFTPSTIGAYGSLVSSTAGANLMLAPFFSDLVIRAGNIANKDISMRYRILGTLGSGAADIIIEWAEMEGFSYAAPNMNFQVILHESGNTIEYNYGNIQKWDGTTNNTGDFSTVCAIGLNGPTPATASLDQRMILERMNTAFFGTTSVTNLSVAPECNSRLLFTPAASYTGGSAPAVTAPANDNVGGAIALTVNTAPCTNVCGTVYNTKNATTSTVNVGGGTMVTCSGTEDDDVWFSFVANGPTKIVVTPTVTYNAAYQLLDASGAVIGCRNTCGVAITEDSSFNTLTAATTYYIRVWDAGTGSAGSGDFFICVSDVASPPANDDPAGAITLTPGLSCTATSSVLPASLSATATTGVATCSAGTPGSPDDDQWFKYTTPADSGNCFTIRVVGVSTYNPVLQLYKGTPSTGNNVTCVNATGNGGTEEIITTSLSPSTDYFIRVYHSGTGAANGNFSICVRVDTPVCVTPTSPINMTNVTATTASLTWTRVPAATSYEIYAGTSNPPSTLVATQPTDSAAYQYTMPTPNQKYYWRVVPKNSYATSTCTRVDSFGHCPSPPAITLDSSNFSLCNGSASGNVSVTSTLANYTGYSWTPTTGISSPTGTTVTFNPTATTAYTLTGVNNTNGCSITAPLTVTVNTPPSALSISQGVSKPQCDARVDSLIASGGLIQFSNMELLSTSSTMSVGTNGQIFRTGAANNATQAIYSASELSRIGLVSGDTIKSIIYETTVAGTPVNLTTLNFSTSWVTDSFFVNSTFITGTTAQSTNSNYATSPGAKSFTLSAPIIWNGSSHLLIQAVTTTSGASGSATERALSNKSNTTLTSTAASPTTGTLSNQRPYIRFDFVRQNPITWSPTTGLFTDRVATVGYSSGHASKLYSKPSTTTKYYAQAQNGICIVRDSIIDSAKATTDMVILALGSASGASAQCTDGGWTYYGTAADPDKLIFAIQKGAWTNGNETVTIGVNGSPYSSTLASNGPNQQHRSWLMGRDWDVTAATQPGSAVLVRFFYDPADTTAVNTDRDAAFAALPGGTLAVKTPFEWFKTTNVPYNAGWRSSIVGNKFPATHIKLTPTYGTQNGVNYVEFSVASFSGGTGGAGFGPSGGGGAGVGLPVTWAGFDVKTAEVGNELTWKTASEQNTDYFEVQYSYDAKEFIAIPEHISAAGNSADLRTYNFTHTDFAPYVYYRIKQVDLDGKFDYSAIKLAKRAAGPSFVVNVFPIPMQEDNLLHVSAKGIDKSTMSITMTDITGKVIRHLSYIPSSESIKESFDMSPLTPGLYFIEVQNGQGKETFKVSR